MISGISKWKIVLYLAGIFAAGGISGWVVAAKTTIATTIRVFMVMSPQKLQATWKSTKLTVKPAIDPV